MSDCPRCQKKNACTQALDQACWCENYPHLLKPQAKAACLCEACLREEMQVIIQQMLEQHKQGKPLGIPRRQKNEPLIEGLDYYMEEGKWVFTEWFHLKRGHCCGNRCRHCPFDHINVKQ
ncbi:MAG: cysteine-rich CWC family protein [Bacteroidota bacterium]